MPPEEKKEEQQPQQAPVPALEPNGAPTADDLTVIKAELAAEKQAKTAAEAELATRANRIAELEASLNVVSQATQTAAAELAQARDATTKAVAKYLDAVRLANPTIPGDVIVGGTIEEIDASVTKALSIATAVKANLEAQAKEAKVPAGAPTRTTINLEGLSPREKIAAGIQQKGGTS
jgi:hypothetical protein